MLPAYPVTTEAPKCRTRQPRNPATKHFLRTICLAGDPSAKSPQHASPRPKRGKTMRQMARPIQAKETP